MHLHFFVGISFTLLIAKLGGIPSVATSSIESTQGADPTLTLLPVADKRKKEDVPDFEGVINSHDTNKNLSSLGEIETNDTLKESESQCVEDAILKGSNGEILSSELDICKSVSVQCIHDSLQKLLEDSTKQVSGQDYACILLNLLQRNTEYAASVTNLESSLKSTQDQLRSLTATVDSQPGKFIPIEKLAYFEKLEKSSATLATSTTQRVTGLERQLTTLSHSITSSHARHTQETGQLRRTISDNKKECETQFQNLNRSLTLDADAFEVALTELNTIGEMWSEISISVRDLQTRTSQNEVVMVSKITEIKTNLTNLATALETRADQSIRTESNLREEFLSELSKTGTELKNDFHKRIQTTQDSYSVLSSNLTNGLETHKNEIKIEMEAATRNLKEMLQIPLRTAENLESKLASELKKEVNRALTAESLIATSLLKSTSVQETNFKALLSKEIKRSSQSVETLENSISQIKSSLTQLREDTQTDIHVESLRAKGTEAQLSSIIVKEVEKVQKEQGEISSKLATLGDVLIQETKRAHSAEEGLEKKILEEEMRALNTESGLLDNINQELKRASEREGELHELCLKNGENLRTAQEDLKSMRKSVDKEIQTQIFNVNTTVHTQFEAVAEQAIKLTQLEASLNSRMDKEISRSAGVEVQLLQEISGLVNTTGQIEARIAQEVATGYERYDGVLSSQTKSSQLLQQDLDLLKLAHDKDLTLIGETLGNLSVLVDTEVGKVGGIVTGIETNFTVHLLTLADEMDTKLEALTNKGDTRFGQIEAEIKELVTFKNATIAKSQPKPAQSSSGVFNRIVGFFGGNRKTTPSNSAKTKKTLISKRLRVEDVFSPESEGSEGVEDDDGISAEEAELISGLSSPRGGSETEKKSGGKGGKSISMGGRRRDMSVMMQRSNSRIRNMYG